MIKKSKLVAGIGVNDADYPIVTKALVGGRWERLWICPFYEVWRSMLRRCYSRDYQSKCPTYVGCTVVYEWLTFSVFREWMITQEWEGAELDKDILARGNKVYSPDTCVFVSHQLNSFMADHGAARGDWPIGVHWHERDGKFIAQCQNPFTRKKEGLGYFDCQYAAHEAWRAKKHEHACRYADMQGDQRIAAALRSKYAKRIDAALSAGKE